MPMNKYAVCRRSSRSARCLLSSISPSGAGLEHSGGRSSACTELQQAGHLQAEQQHRRGIAWTYASLARCKHGKITILLQRLCPDRQVLLCILGHQLQQADLPAVKHALKHQCRHACHLACFFCGYSLAAISRHACCSRPVYSYSDHLKRGKLYTVLLPGRVMSPS